MKRLILHIIALFLPYLLVAQIPTKNVIPGHLIVRLGEKVAIQDFVHNMNSNQKSLVMLHQERALAKAHNIHLLSFDPISTDAVALFKKIEAMPSVRSVTWDYNVELRSVPNDSLYTEQQDYYNIIDLPQAWDITKGGTTPNGDTIVIAVVDSGADPNHPDLYENIWHNKAEIPNDGIDQDKDDFIKDFIDDYYGWDFNESIDSLPVHYHGITVQGVIGAMGNNTSGVAGVNWHVKIMTLKANTLAQLTEASYYVLEQRKLYNETMGAKGSFVVAMNISLGFSGLIYEDGISWCNSFDDLGEVGVITVGATSNSGSTDVDADGDLPSNCPSNYFICVTSTDNSDQKEGAYGNISVDMAAPGNVFTTTTVTNVGNSPTYYTQKSGTSYATPMVTGAIGLIYSVPDYTALATQALTDPKQAALNVRASILNGVEKINNLESIVTTGGRLNVLNAINETRSFYGLPQGTLDVLNVFPNPTRNEFLVAFQTPVEVPYAIRVYNMLGEIMYDAKLQDNDYLNRYYKIQCSGWPMGARTPKN